MDDEPECPPALEYLWGWFLDIGSTRGGGYGPAPITYPDIDAWARLTGNDPTPWEVRMLRRIDNAYMAFQAERMEKK